MATQIQVRRDTAANWTSANPTLAAGEIGFETDQNKFKIGTGAVAYNSLSYAGGSELGNTLSNVNTITSEAGSNMTFTADGGTMTLGVDGATHSTFNKDGSTLQISTDQVVVNNVVRNVYSETLGSGNISLDYANGQLQKLTLAGGDPQIIDISNGVDGSQLNIVVVQPSGTDCLIQAGGNVATPGGTTTNALGGNVAYDQFATARFHKVGSTWIIEDGFQSLKAPNA